MVRQRSGIAGPIQIPIQAANGLGEDLLDEELSFGEWLKRRRKSLGLTQEELAGRVGCSTILLRKIEAEERRPSIQIAERLAEFLQIDPPTRPTFVRFARGELGGGSRMGPPAVLEAGPPPPPTRPRPVRVAGAIPLTPLIGREQDSTALRALLLQDATRLVTLVGPPGIGKTRLALHVARDLETGGDFQDKVAFVSLSEIEEPRLVLPAIAQAIGIREPGHVSLRDRILSTVREQRLLLVLDNFEQVVEAASILTDLLGACPSLKALVTSRAALRVEAEVQYPVPPLPIPSLERLPPADQLTSFPAIRLFEARARAIRPDFAITPENAAAITAICARLDGLPLAIELTAAWINVLPPRELLAELGGKLVLHLDGFRGRLPRHQTMHNAIQWSYDLLDPGEQTLFVRLSIFVGGFDLEAAQVVCRDPMIPAEVDSELLRGISSLLDKSLLLRVEGPGKGARYSMLSTIREFALESLRGSQAAADLGRRHAGYFLALAEHARERLHGNEQSHWIGRMAVDHDNFRAGMAWSLEVGETETAARLAGALWQFWLIQGHLSEGRLGSERLLEQPGFDTLAVQVRSDVLNAAGVLAGKMGDYLQAVEWLERRLRLLRPTGDDRAIASSLNNLGLLALDQGDTDRAGALFGESLAIFRGVGFQPGVGLGVHNLGLVESQRENWVEAEVLFVEALRLSRESGNQRLEAWCLTEIGLAAFGVADLPRSLEILKKSLALKIEVADRETVPWTVEGLARVAVRQGRADHAARLMAASQALRNELGIPLPPAYIPDFENDVAQASAALGPAAMEAAWLEGSAMTMEDLLAVCLGDSSGQAKDSTAGHK